MDVITRLAEAFTQAGAAINEADLIVKLLNATYIAAQQDPLDPPL